MKTEKNILIAFILNLSFSILELFGGIFTGSIAIISDALHDFGDAISIGISFVFEKKSKKQPDKEYTYGYARFSVLGGIITTLILLVGSGVVIYNAIIRILNPVPINYSGMLVLAGIGLVVNALATYFTHGGHSINQKAVNLHMLEDLLGWLVILIGAGVMYFTNFYILDPILSILVAVFVLFSSIRNLKEILDIFLIKKPRGIDTEEIIEHILCVDGVVGVHHLHLWTLDGENVYATMHVVVKEYDGKIKTAVKEELSGHNICHATIEIETETENCGEKECVVKEVHHSCGHHHHGHNHSHSHAHHEHKHEHKNEHKCGCDHHDHKCDCAHHDHE